MKRIHIAFIVVFALPALAQTQSSQTSNTASNTAAQTTSKKKNKKKTVAASPKASAQITIPKGAVLDPKDGNYHFTDKTGRKWVYMMTPMGPSRWEDKGPSAKSPSPAQPPSSNRFSDDPNLKAFDQGDTVKFVRTTPFGPQTWTKKKSELTDDERGLLANATPAGSSPAGNKTQN